jgi:UPF0042 nucleotide-binding protein
MDGTPTPAKLVIVSGRSGSGKSTALHVLEDAGFYCIDNLPALLLPELIEQARESDGIANKRMAVSIDARNMAGHLSRFGDILRMLPQDLLTEVIYLDADDATLIRRFSETRRKHPLSNRNTSLNEAIAAERTLLAAIAERAALTIDTSALSPHDLRELVGRTVAVETDGSMVILFESFGFKHGIPIYADMVFDLRCLPNPHWNPALRRLSGLDEDVAHFLQEQPEVGEMLGTSPHTSIAGCRASRAAAAATSRSRWAAPAASTAPSTCASSSSATSGTCSRACRCATAISPATGRTEHGQQGTRHHQPPRAACARRREAGFDRRAFFQHRAHRARRQGRRRQEHHGRDDAGRRQGYCRSPCTPRVMTRWQPWRRSPS